MSKENEETELRNAAKYLRGRSYKTMTLLIDAISWADMLERAADRIADLEAALESRLIA